MDPFRRILRVDAEPEDLCDELDAAKIQRDGKWILNHRLIVEPDYDPEHNARYNRELESCRSKADALKMDKQWREYVCAHPKEHYPAILEEIKSLTTTAVWCEAVRSAWYLSDVLWINRDAWLRIFSDSERIAGVTTKQEAAYLAAQVDPLTVYRGCLPMHVDGLSWSLSFSATEHFKREAGFTGVIYSGIVKKYDVLAYMNPNNEEFEVIVSPEHVTNKEIAL